MSCGSSWGTLSSAACTIVAARSSERSSLSEPLKARPMGERAVATMTGSGMADSSDRRGVESHGTGRQPNGVRSGAAMHGPVGLGTDRREHGGHQRGIARGGGVKAVRAEQARLGGERAGQQPAQRDDGTAGGGDRFQLGFGHGAAAHPGYPAQRLGDRSDGGQVGAGADDDPHVGVIMIGANDVTHRVSPQQAATDLYRAVVRLRAAGVRVVVGTCPDLAAVRPIAQPLRWVAGVRSRAMAEAQLEAVTAAGGSVVPLGRLLARTFTTEPGLFCPDRFHPSAAGYAALMAAMLPAVRAEADRSVHRGTRPNPVRLPPSTVTLDAASVRGVRHA